MTTTNTVQLASVRVITEDLPRLVRFYEAVTGATAQWLTDDFVELATPSATFALSHPRPGGIHQRKHPPSSRQ